jgi:hypothetical protein
MQESTVVLPLNRIEVGEQHTATRSRHVVSDGIEISQGHVYVCASGIDLPAAETLLRYTDASVSVVSRRVNLKSAPFIADDYRLFLVRAAPEVAFLWVTPPNVVEKRPQASQICGGGTAQRKVIFRLALDVDQSVLG